MCLDYIYYNYLQVIYFKIKQVHLSLFSLIFLVSCVLFVNKFVVLNEFNLTNYFQSDFFIVTDGFCMVFI